MNMFKRTLTALSLVALASTLAACITLLPEEKAAQLYRFDADIKPPATAEGTQFTVARLGGSFVQAASNDRIMTTTGSQVAYIAQSRWASPASVLFTEALSRAFDANAGPARLLTRGDAGKADYILRVDVTDFAANYDRGAKAAPEIIVSLRATLTGSNRTLAGATHFEARVRASDNRVSAIVAAYDQAVAQALGELVAWTNNKGVA